MNPQPRMTPGDFALLMTFGAVSLYFLRRYVAFRKVQSLGVAFLPMGFMFLAIDCEVSVRTIEWAKWVSVVFGALLLFSVISRDRLREDGQ